jgi:proteasome accessory factor C
LPAWLGSFACSVAEIVESARVTLVPDSTVAEAKASFAGGAAMWSVTLPLSGPAPKSNPSTAIRYVVPATAVNVTRLVRMLNLVPYFQANPRVSYTKAAAALGVSVKQLKADVKQLWMCGLPGYGPGDLIDFELDDDTVKVTFSAGIDRPLRLTSPEATGLLVALRALADIPGVVDPAAARSAIAKIEAAAGTLIDDDEPSALDEPAPMESEGAAAVRAAVRDSRAVGIDYYSASRDTLSSRVVDPIRVVLVGDQSYLEAWCREAEGVRLFRFDRIVAARVLDEPAAPPRPAVEAPPNTALFEADPSLPSATLKVAPAAAWMLEYFPMRVLRELPGGYCEAAMTYAAEEWLARQLLGFGGDIEVLSPESLAQRVRQAAVEALDAYSQLGQAALDAG